MRVSEVYASTQGEGPNVGQTTVFLRFGGCNLRCPGWPCDTQHAIDPAFRKTWDRTDPLSLAERVNTTAQLAGARLITFTGGEPFLQPRAELSLLASELSNRGYRLEAFTNGTLEYPEWAVNNISMIMDWKLPGSGEDPTNQMRFQNLLALTTADIHHSVKFVCKDEADFEYAFSLWSLLQEEVQKTIWWYYGRVWDGEITNARLVELAMLYKVPWRLNVQMHNYIWDPQERGR